MDPDNEGGELELTPFDSMSQRGSTNSSDEHNHTSSFSDEEMEGGMPETINVYGKNIKKEKLEFMLSQQSITMVKSGKNYVYYKKSMIEDKGFNKWRTACDQTAIIIKWVALFLSFKFYRMTYSFFMGNKNFLVIYQKKKFKKHTVLVTLISQFLVKLPLIISGFVSIGSLPFGQQVFFTMVDSLVIAIFLIILEFIEIATLDKIMKTVNTSGQKQRKSAAACASSDEDDIGISSSESDANNDDDEVDGPDWRLCLKHVEGNTQLFK
jgi:hypothetical protein